MKEHPCVPIRTGRVLARLIPIALVALLVTACSGGASGGIKTSDPWARTSPMVAGAGAAYVVIENTGSEADTLVGAASDVAKSVEVHETYEVASEMPAESGMPAESAGMGGAESPMASAGMASGPDDGHAEDRQP